MTPRSLGMQDDQLSGSSPPGEPEFLVVGKLGKPHGIHGEIVMDVYTDFPERLKPGVVVYIGPQFKPIQIVNRRTHSRGLILSFDGYQSREAVAALRNLLVQVPSTDRPALPNGEYYQHQLLGLKVIDDNGLELGWISAILETGANDVFVVKDKEGSEVLIPDIESVILDIDLGGKQIKVHLLPGLLPER
ncbi:MAG: ribosome maturation factor RimM [Anaerolineales bacterium]